MEHLPSDRRLANAELSSRPIVDVVEARTHVPGQRARAPVLPDGAFFFSPTKRPAVMPRMALCRCSPTAEAADLRSAPVRVRIPPPAPAWPSDPDLKGLHFAGLDSE